MKRWLKSIHIQWWLFIMMENNINWGLLRN